MRLAWHWVVATTVSLATSTLLSTGCFSPTINAGDECTSSGQCPGSLNCNDGFCCEGDTLCGGLDDAGPADAPPPDADPLAFRDHLEPFTCDGETMYLLHFDTMPFANAPGCSGTDVLTHQDPHQATSWDAPFLMAANLDPAAAMRTKYVEGDEGQLPVDTQELTIEAWFDVARPTAQGSDIATLVSAVRPNLMMVSITDATFLVGLRANGVLAVELFEDGDCRTRDARSFSSQTSITPGTMHHFRLSVSQSTVKLYIDAVLDTEVDLGASPVCTDVREAALRVGGVDISTNEFEFATYKAAVGRIDEVRYSSVAR